MVTNVSFTPGNLISIITLTRKKNATKCRKYPNIVGPYDLVVAKYGESKLRILVILKVNGLNRRITATTDHVDIVHFSELVGFVIYVMDYFKLV